MLKAERRSPMESGKLKFFLSRKFWEEERELEEILKAKDNLIRREAKVQNVKEASSA